MVQRSIRINLGREDWLSAKIGSRKGRWNLKVTNLRDKGADMLNLLLWSGLSEALRSKNFLCCPTQRRALGNAEQHLLQVEQNPWLSGQLTWARWRRM